MVWKYMPTVLEVISLNCPMIEDKRNNREYMKLLRELRMKLLIWRLKSLIRRNYA